MQIQTQVGPVASTTSIAAGTTVVARSGQLGDLISSELHGRYYEQSYRRNIFNAANQTGIVTTNTLAAAAYTGLMLSNPVGSTINVVVNKAGFGFNVLWPNASIIALLCGYNSSTNVTHTVAGTPRSNFFGVGSAGQALVDTSSTTPSASVITHILGVGSTGALTTEMAYGPTIVDLEGSLILPPGAWTGFYTSAVSGAAGGFFSFQWEEVPV